MAQTTHTSAACALVLICIAMVSQAIAQEYTFGQATWYDSILNGFCGFGSNIPSNGFVGAWPFIETGPGGQGFWQPPSTNACADVCFEVSCVPQFVESSDGNIYLDRRDACADPRRAVIIKIVDECRCSLPAFPGGPRGNFLWCCNTPTPRLGINRHIDLSQQAFTQLVKDGNFNLGIIGIRWRQVPCTNIGVITLPETPSLPTPPGNVTQGTPGVPQVPPTAPPGMTGHDMCATGNSPFAEYKQCGGRGSFCSVLGGCVDAPFPGRSCAAGLTCKRQNEWYWQCLKDSSSSSSSSSGGSSSGGGGSPGSGVLQLNQQCGGFGGQCKDTGRACVDGPFPGLTCASGLRCIRKDGYYWQCLDAQAIQALDSSWTVARPEPTSSCPRYVSDGGQCGGKGGQCASGLPGGVCEDRAAQGVCCEPGHTCVRQNEWYWGCKRT